MRIFPMIGQPFMEGKTLEQRVAELEARLDAIVTSQRDRWIGDEMPHSERMLITSEQGRALLNALPEAAFDVNHVVT